jgi:ribosomal subunit interface protein
MTLRISGKNLAIGDSLRSHVQDRIDGVIAKYHAGSPTGHVTIEPEGSGYRSDCTLFLDSGITLQVEAVAHEPYMSFDRAADRIEKRLRRHKKRLAGHHASNAYQARLADGGFGPLPADDGLDDLNDEIPGETFAAVIAERANGFKVMTVASAVRELDDMARAFVIFRYADNKRINIVYRRPDGNIGWIDPPV